MEMVNMKWINIKNELPPFAKMVLVYGPCSAHWDHYAIACRRGKGGKDFEWHRGYCSDPLTCDDYCFREEEIWYWMELPKEPI